jgi:hypothetical protein
MLAKNFADLAKYSVDSYASKVFPQSTPAKAESAKAAKKAQA